MAKYELKLPEMGESVAEATITTWLKSVGDTVEEDESVVEVATDKVDSEVPSEVTGVIKEILFQPDDVVKVGQVMAIIEIEGEEDTSPSKSESKEEDTKEIEKNAEEVEKSIDEVQNAVRTPRNFKNEEDRFYSPLVRSIAEKENISVEELDNIEGTGLNGRVTKQDIFDFIENRGEKIQMTIPKSISSPTPVAVTENDEVISMSRMGKMIAEHMTRSKHTSAHVQSFTEADVTRIWNWRNRVKGKFEAREKQKFTFTPIFMSAVAKAIQDFPMMNISVDGDKIIKKANINLGMATALPDGNLIVPVIKNADRLSLTEMAKVVNDLANRARNNQLKPEEVKNGTYTVTNIGSFGNVFGTPIINQPQVGILALGAIRKVPAVVETPSGDAIAVRYKMMLSHSYDHRVVNGALGGMFVQRVAEYLEKWDIEREV